MSAAGSGIGTGIRGVELGRHAFTKRLTNLFSIGIPLAGLVAAVFWYRRHPLTWIDVSSFLIFYVISGVGVGVGLHRTFSHRSIVPVKGLKLALAFAGSLAFQGSVLRWVADHRRHHRYTDVIGDTHSPLTTADGRMLNWLVGLFHAHVGWLFDRTTTDYALYAPDVLKDRMLMAFHYLYWPLCGVSLGLPFLYGYLLGGWEAAVGSMLAGGCVRTVALHNVIWAVNSIGHTFGTQDIPSRDSSRNHFWLAILTFGEGWHNNHHAQPRSAFNDWKWTQIDLNGIIIRGLLWLRLAKDAVYPVPVASAAARTDAIAFVDGPEGPPAPVAATRRASGGHNGSMAPPTRSSGSR